MKNTYILMDYQNQPVDPDLVVEKVNEYGKVIGGKAYGHWAKYPATMFSFLKHGIELIEMPEVGYGNKNGNDIKLAVDAVEIMFILPHIEIFVLVTGDSDFVPLVKKLKIYGKSIFVVSRRKSLSVELQSVADIYIPYEDIVKAEKVSDVDTIDDISENIERIINERKLKTSENVIRRIISGMNFNYANFNYSSATAMYEDIIKKILKEKYVAKKYEENCIRFIEKLVVNKNLLIDEDTLKEIIVQRNLWNSKNQKQTLNEFVEELIKSQRLLKDKNGIISIPVPRRWEIRYSKIAPHPVIRKKFAKFVYRIFSEKKVIVLSEVIEQARIEMDLSSKILSSFGIAMKFSGQFLGSDGSDYVSLNTPVKLTCTENELIFSLSAFYVKNILKDENICKSQLKELAFYIFGKKGKEKYTEKILDYLINTGEVILNDNVYIYVKNMVSP